ncbi:MAG: trigger factor, partial [Bacteroidetes bacterium]|nr:trigger factor [Bacteroidota bacterium]
NDGELPDNFDREAFRAQNREEAERQARWMIIRDQIIEDEDLEVTDEDRDAFFAKQAGEEAQLSAEQLRGFYEQMNVMGRVEQQLLSDKVFTHLRERFTIVEKDRETLEAELKAKRDAAADLAPAS